MGVWGALFSFACEMETMGWTKKRDSRRLSRWHTPGDALPHYHLFSLLHLLLWPAVALFSGCCELPQQPEEPAAETPAADSLVRTRITPVTPLSAAILHLDLAVYAEEAPRRLEYHARTPYGAEIEARTPPGDKRVVLIANSPYALNYEALQAYDAMEQLESRFADEDPAHPLLSGVAVVPAGRQGEVPLEPLLGEVILVSVDNRLPAGTLLEQPRVRLCQVSTRAELLRTGPFHPSETQDGAFVSLPGDIGYFPVRPLVRLPCYPFEASDAGAGAARLEFACDIAGTERLYPQRLPSLPRGHVLCVELTILDTLRCTAQVYDGGPLRMNSP